MLIKADNKWEYFGFFIISFSLIGFLTDGILMVVLAFIVGFLHPYIITYDENRKK